jgi:hypothetical protein
MFEGERPVGLWVDVDLLRAEDVTVADVAQFILNYRMGDNMESMNGVPDQYLQRRREKLFEAAFPSKKMGKVWQCATARAGGGLGA